MIIRVNDERTLYLLEKFGFTKSSIFGKYDYSTSQEGLFPHHHYQSIEICFMIRGRQMFHVHKEFFSLQGGDCFITYPREIHSTGGFHIEKGALIWLILGVKSGKTPPELQKLIQMLIRRRVRHFKNSDQIPALLRNMIEALESPESELKILKVRNYISSLLIDCIEGGDRSPIRTTTPVISKALRAIESSFGKLYISDLAKMTGLSVSRFKGKFKEETGFSPQDYLLRKRIDRSIELLRQPKANVTEVAFEMGFSSSQYFATVFKRYTRHSPKSFLLPQA